nr:Unknown Function [uncultured bacterium]
MNPDDLILPAAFYDSCAYFFERADRWSASRFGGPSDVTISGVKHGPRRLHHIATLGGKDLPIGKFFLWLPLFYGLAYTGCTLQYRKLSTSSVELFELEPTKSTEDFPYRDYPPLLPYLPLRVAKIERCDFREFSELSCQPNWDIDASSLIVLVPPSPILGMSLWGPSGDAECSQIVFECDVFKGVIKAFSQCG